MLVKNSTTLKTGLQQFAMDEERIIVRVSERHDIELRNVLNDYRQTEAPSVDDIQRVETLDRQIKSMGAINLTAIEEHEEVKSRYEFLNAQREDLEKALENLRRAIQKINRSSRERFRKAYDSVNEMFQKIYPGSLGEGRLASNSPMPKTFWSVASISSRSLQVKKLRTLC